MKTNRKKCCAFSIALTNEMSPISNVGRMSRFRVYVNKFCLFLFINQFYEVELETGAVISPLIYTKEQWNRHSASPLFEKIQKEGIRL